MNRLVPAAFVIACVLTLASPTGAQPYSLVPSDNSAADQYTEAFPGAGGNNRPTKSGGATPDPSKPNSELPASIREGLADLGPAGEAAAQVIERTVNSAGDARPRPGNQGSRRGDADATEGGLPVFDGEADSGLKAGFLGITEVGLGLLLPLLLLLTAGVAVVLVRRNQNT